MIALVAAALLAQANSDLPPIPPPMKADESATAYACSFEKVLRAEECTYEAVPAPGESAANARLALQALLRACDGAASDDAMRKICLEEGAAIARSRKCARSDTRLADEANHLVQKASECAQALRRVIARTERRATLSGDCCTCLEDARCGVSLDQCRHELGDLLKPGSALQSCLRRSCQDECPIQPASEAPEEAPLPAPRKVKSPSPHKA